MDNLFEPGYYKLSKVVEGFPPPDLWATHSSRTADSRSKHQRVSAAVRANQEIEQPSPPPLSKGVASDDAAFCSQGGQSDQVRRTYGLLSGCSNSQADLVVQTSCPHERHLRKGTLTFDILTNCQWGVLFRPLSTFKKSFKKNPWVPWTVLSSGIQWRLLSDYPRRE